MTDFFTSDTHFGHTGAIRSFNRPFASAPAMDDALVENWNAAVGPEDRVFHLGDFCFKGSKRAATLLERLNGRITLVRGNHDSANTAQLAHWVEVADLLEVEIGRTRVVLCHYPLLEWPGAFRGALHLHGHTHGRVPPNARRADVGADVWAYRPVTLDEITARLAEAPAYDPETAYRGLV